MSSLLTLADYAIIVIILAIFPVMGFYFRLTGGRQKTTQEFLMADKNMPVLPVTFSILATIMSAISVLGLPTDSYLYGFHLLFTHLTYPIGSLMAIYCILPVYFDMDIKTIYEYLEKRFGKSIKIVTSLLYCINMFLYMPIVIYAPALALNAVTGLSLWTSVISIAIVCTLYSTLGGLKAVLWTDLLQGILMTLTLLLLIIKGSTHVGGFGKIIETAQEGQRLDIFNTNIDFIVRYSVWGTMVHGIITGAFYNASTFTVVQRLMSCGSLRKAQSSAAWGAFLCPAFMSLAGFLGIVIYAYFQKCDPLSNKAITSSDQLVPLFMMELFGHMPGLPGFCVAGIFSAALSTMSSGLNCVVAVTLEDYINPCMKYRLKESTTIILAKYLVLFYGGLCLILVYTIANAKGLLETTIAFSGMIGGVNLGVFCLGMFTVRTNEPGALIGLLSGIALNFWIVFGALHNKSKYPPLPLSTEGCASGSDDYLFNASSSFTNITDTYIFNATGPYRDSITKGRYIFPLYKVSYMWFGAIGMTVTCIVGYLASSILGFWIPEKETDPKCLSPIVRKWLCKLPSTNVEDEYIKLQTNYPDGKE